MPALTTPAPTTPAPTVLKIAYLSLGSNIGDREPHLQSAVSRLEAAGRVLAVSSIYETEPVEFTRQPWFLNCAVALETSCTPRQLMSAILQIEEDMGRRRVQDKGPRSIDIDILLFADEIVNSEGLTIPHPSMAARRFVLEPMAEIAPQARHPVLNQTVLQLRDALPAGQVARRISRESLPDAERRFGQQNGE